MKRAHGVSGDLRYGLESYKRRRLSGARPTQSQVAAALVRQAPGLVRVGGNYGRYGVNARKMGLEPERKFFDTALSFNFDATGEVPATGQLALIPQGDTESTRDGRYAWIRSIQLRGVVHATPSSAATFSDSIYLYVVLDTQANGAAAAVTDVFTSSNMGTNMLNLNNSGRFRILKKFVLNINPPAGATTAYNTVTRALEWYKRCNIKMDWSSTTGAIGEIRSNNIFLLAGAAGNTDDSIGFTGTCRLRFQG